MQVNAIILVMLVNEILLVVTTTQVMRLIVLVVVKVIFLVMLIIIAMKMLVMMSLPWICYSGPLNRVPHNQNMTSRMLHFVQELDELLIQARTFVQLVSWLMVTRMRRRIEQKLDLRLDY